MRSAEIRRKTAETDIQLALDLDGAGKSDVATGCGFLDHMLTLFARHGQFDLTVRCWGDTYVDDHHTVEDIGICLGDALRQALGTSGGSPGTAAVSCPWTRLWSSLPWTSPAGGCCAVTWISPRRRWEPLTRS